MKLNEHGGFDGLDEKIRIYAAADYRDDEAGGDGYEGNDLFDDEEEEEVVVTMPLEDDEALGLLEDIAGELLGPGLHDDEAIFNRRLRRRLRVLLQRHAHNDLLLLLVAE